MESKLKLFNELGNVFDDYNNKYYGKSENNNVIKSKLLMVDNPYYEIDSEILEEKDFSNLKFPLEVFPSIEGSILSIYYKEGKLDKILLRAPSIRKGYDVTHLLDNNPNIHRKLSEKIDTSVKAYITISRNNLFYMNLLNIMKGNNDYCTIERSINMLHNDNIEQVKDIPYSIFPYDLTTETDLPFDRKKIRLMELGFYECIGTLRIRNKKEFEDTIKGLDNINTLTNIIINGLIVLNENEKRFLEINGYRFTSTVISITNKIDKYGILIPYAIIDPVRINKNIVIDEVNLLSYEYMKELGIKENDRINIINDGNMVFCTSIIKSNNDAKQDYEPPKVCPFCSSKLKEFGKNGLKCVNAFCPRRVKLKIIRYCNKLGIDIDENDLSMLIHKKLISSPYDLYFLKDFENMYEIKNKKKVYRQIERSKRNDLYKLIDALGVPGMNENNLYCIFRYCNDRIKVLKELVPEEVRNIANTGNNDIYKLALDYMKSEEFLNELEIMREIVK